jgi:DNA-directed RNA polymerase specialized sigma24 family protein
MGFARTIVRRKVAGQIRQRIEDRSRLCSMHPEWFLASGTRENPELLAIEKQRLVLARVAIACLPKRDREILTRFYIEEQSKEQICSEMNLTETQFRLVKSRTKAMLASRTCSLRGDSPAKRRTAPRTRQ